MLPHRQLLPVGGKRVNSPTALACERNALLLLKRHISFVSALTPVVYYSLLAESSPGSLMKELIPPHPPVCCVDWKLLSFTTLSSTCYLSARLRGP